MAIRTIFVVKGCGGESDDYQEWNVISFPTEAQAVAHADAANKWIYDNRTAISEGGRNRFSPFDLEFELNHWYDPYYKVEPLKFEE